MKKSTSYFGNRFTSALRGFRARRRSPQISVLPAPVAAAPEFEALEGRILLSGITAGKVYKSVKFTDADGDEVIVKLTGKLAKGAGFTIDLLGGAENDSDIDNIKLFGTGNTNALSVMVKPKTLFKGTSVIPTVYSGGTTMIGAISADNGVTALRGINLSAAIVSSIDLGNVNVGGISLNTGRAQFVDRLNMVNNANFFPYQPVTGDIDFNDITAKSIGTLSIRGVQAAGPGVLGDTTNDFNGQITVGDGNGKIGSILAPFSNVNGGLSVGSIGKITVLALNTDLNVSGDLTIQFNDGFFGNLTVGGHLNFGLSRGDMDGTLIAGNGISGLSKSTTDAIRLPGDFFGQMNTFNNPEFTNIGIADISVSGEFAGAVSSSSSIGNVSGQVFNGANVAASTTLGNVTATGGYIGGTFAANESIGNISARGTIFADFTAGTSIGTVSSTAFGGNYAITGTFTALGGDIGAVTASAVDGNAIYNAKFNAAGSIGAITASVSGAAGGSAIYGATFKADSDADNVGGIGNITATSGSQLGVGIGGGSSFTGASIGDISVTMAKSSQANAIANSTFTGVTNTETEPTSGKFNDLGTIGNITVNHQGTGDGINSGFFYAGQGGAGIGNVTVTTANGTGILYSGFYANQGTATDTLSEAVIGNILVASSKGAGVQNVQFQAVNGIGNISATSQNFAINNSTFNANTDGDNSGSIGSITAKVTGAGSNGITGGSTFTGTDIGDISVTLTSLSGTGIGINGAATFTAETAVDVLDKDGKVVGTNNTGAIGTITVSNASTDPLAHGIVGSKFNAGAAGTGIGAITVTTAGGEGINGSNFLANVGFGANGDTFTGSIGAITVNAGSAGINAASTFTASQDIGAISVTSVGNSITGSNFTANDNNGISKTNTGSIASISVTASDESSTGIAGFATFTAAAIGDISATVSNAKGGVAIDTASFTAVTAVDTLDKDGKVVATDNTGTIGNITVNSSSTTDSAISLGNFQAGSKGSIGTISVTAVGGAGIAAVSASVFDTTNAGALAPSFTSTIGAVTVTSTAGNGVSNSGIYANAGVGAVTITSAGTALQNSFITGDSDNDKTGGVGNISATVTGKAGIGLDFTGGSITGASIGDITVSLTSADNTSNAIVGTGANDVLATAGTIGTITVSTAGTGSATDNVGFVAETGITAFTATGNVVDTSLDTSKVGTIGNVSVAGNMTNLLVSAGTSIGSITGTGTGDQSLTLVTIGDKGGIGALSFSALDDKTATVTVTDAVSIGNITVATTGAKNGNLDLSDANTTLVTLGNISVDGTLTLSTDLTSAKTVGTVNAGVITGNADVGTGLAGSSIGLITITNGNVGANDVAFAFASMNGRTFATADGLTNAVEFTAVGSEPNISTFDARDPGVTSLAGVTVNLVNV